MVGRGSFANFGTRGPRAARLT